MDAYGLKPLKPVVCSASSRTKLTADPPVQDRYGGCKCTSGQRRTGELWAAQGLKASTLKRKINHGKYGSLGKKTLGFPQMVAHVAQQLDSL